MDTSYRALLGLPAARRLLAALAFAWLSFGMVGLAVLLAALRASGSYAVAGAAVAAFSVGAGALAPVRGRLVDRRGGRQTLPVLAFGYALGLAGVAVFRATPGLLGSAVLAGLCAPPLVATCRAAWAATVPANALRRAYALTSLLGDLSFVAAPALAGVLATFAPGLALGLCAGSAVIAALLVGSASPPSPPRAGRILRVPGMASLLAVSVALGGALGLIEVAVPAAADGWGARSLSGVLLGAFALGSAIGGLWFGRRVWTASPERRYLTSLVVLSLGLAPLALAWSPLSLGLLLVPAGLAYGPGRSPSSSCSTSSPREPRR